LLNLGPTVQPVDEVPETAFYIPGTGSSTRPRRTLKQGDCFAVFDSYADIGAVLGMYYRCATSYGKSLDPAPQREREQLLGECADKNFGTLPAN